ncbi:unnamed protein product [Caenorhabditis sp. 36 PRJEB53466]|nr:unnamed protein product [Caenorhabditis sp. 36 PRJEB53466]
MVNLLDKRLFFAARRCYYTDGITFLMVICPSTGQTLKVTEKKLSEQGIRLGDFIFANGSPENVKEYTVTDYQLDIRIDGNFAMIENLTADLVKENGMLVFKTKQLGLVKSLDQSLALGKYRITVRACTSSDNSPTAFNNYSFCAEANEKLRDTAYIPRLYPSYAPLPSLPTAWDSFPSPDEPLPNIDQLNLSSLFNNFSTISSSFKMPGSSDAPSEPIPPVSTFRTCLMPPADSESPENVTVGAGFKVKESPIRKTMRAFVIFRIKKDDSNIHYIWVCDIQRRFQFISKHHELDIGHFFEGQFEQMPNGIWSQRYTKYERPIDAFIEGCVNKGRVELTVTISNYEPVGEGRKYAQVRAEHIGVIMDVYSKLPVNCQERQARIQQSRLDNNLFNLAANWPTCSATTNCPPGGLWTEWTVTGRQECAGKCGSCDALFYTRTCASSSAGCECEGAISKYERCNTQTCAYPAQRTCCIPYVPMLINGSMQCGPIPKQTSKYTPCCPIGGLWSKWSGFARNSADTAWIRTRKCASASAGCSCVGESVESQTDCPCVYEMDQIDRCAGSQGRVRGNTLESDHATCKYVANILAKNNGGTACNKYTTYTSYNYVSALAIVYKGETSCEMDRPFHCNAPTGDRMPFTLTCDLETQYWRYDFNGREIEGWLQLYLNPN